MKRLVIVTPALLCSIFLMVPAHLALTSVEARQRKTNLPEYVLRVPAGHFVGLSGPSRNLQEARMSSIDNAVKQILRALGATYSMAYTQRVYGSVRNVTRHVEDNFSVLAEWFVKEVEQNIVRSDFVTDEQDRYTFFTLIRFPHEKLQQMRRLTIGPNIMARVVGIDGKTAKIEVGETNGVRVTLYEYEIKSERSFSRAGFVSYYIWKVPKSKRLSYGRTLGKPVIVCESSNLINIPLSCTDKSLSDYLLGASQTVEIILKGYDEVGRAVTKNVALH